MTGRHKIRELAMQVLFLWDTNGEADPLLAAQVAGDDQHVTDEMRRDALRLATDAWQAREALPRNGPRSASPASTAASSAWPSTS
jgi:hypothetical protein